MTLVDSDRALPTCGTALSQLRLPFCTRCAPSSLSVCVCFFFFYFSASYFKFTVIFPPMTPIKKTYVKEEKIKRFDITFFLDVF